MSHHRFIMDLGGKSVVPCFGNNTAVTFQNVNNNSVMPVPDITPVENNFALCNGKADLDRCESLNLSSRQNICNDCDENSYSDPVKTNSSQCSLSFNENSVCANLGNELSSLCINESTSEPQILSNRCEASSDKNCERICDTKNEELESSSHGTESFDPDESSKRSCQSKRPARDTEQNSCVESEKEDSSASEIVYISYESENQMPDIMKLIQKDLSEPYSIYTYRYFIHNWPHLCFLVSSFIVNS